MKTEHVMEWAELAFASKKPLKDLNAIFLAAPRDLSEARLKQLLKTYLPKGNLVIGIAAERYVLGLEDQPQFEMLRLTDVEQLVTKINKAGLKHTAHILHYSQRDVDFIYQKVPFQHVLLVNGSWYHGFHHRPEYYTLVNGDTPYTMLSPFNTEQEAQDYARRTKLSMLPKTGTFNESEMLNLARAAATHSYDYAGFQTGGVLAKKVGSSYELLASAHNRIVPYETYAMHHGSEREKHFSPVNDLNYYDTIHYEIGLLISAVEQGIDIAGTTLFETVLSCPHCARMVAATNIAEVVYEQDHSSGYAVRLLEAAGKKVRRVV